MAKAETAKQNPTLDERLKSLADRHAQLNHRRNELLRELEATTAEILRVEGAHAGLSELAKEK